MSQVVICVIRDTGEEGGYSFPSESKAEEFIKEVASLARGSNTEIAISRIPREQMDL